MDFRWVLPCVARVCIAVWLGFAPSSASADDEPTGTLTLSQAISAALAGNPDLAVAAYELKAGDTRIIQAGLRPNPEISLYLEDFAGTKAAFGIREMQSTLSLSQVIELGGKRSRRIGVATSGRDLLDIERQIHELDVLSEVTRRFIDVVTAQEHLSLAREAAALADRTKQAISARVQTARSPWAELSRATIASTRAQIAQHRAETRLHNARQALAVLWGGTEARFDVARADLYRFVSLDSLESLRERLRRNPNFARFASEARLRDAELRLAQAEARPNIALEFGVRRYEATDAVGLVAGFSLGLPLFNRNQGAVAEATIRQSQTIAAEQAALARADATLAALYRQALASREEADELRTAALPQAQAALDQTQYGYERGRFSYLDLTTAQQELLALRLAAIDAAADFHRLVAEIERLAGEAVAQPNIPFGN
jgi:cobalt-zinc-cadmium efflux system outer membrane protein